MFQASLIDNIEKVSSYLKELDKIVRKGSYMCYVHTDTFWSLPGILKLQLFNHGIIMHRRMPEDKIYFAKSPNNIISFNAYDYTHFINDLIKED